MIQFRLSELEAPLVARLLGADVAFSSVSTDSRTLLPGDLFVALQGPRCDGHDHLAQAEQRGAVAAMVSRETGSGLPQLLVDDTRLRLGDLARLWRRASPAPLVAVTGSNGKTTVKEMLASILGVRGSVLATRGNLNNDIGVPLTLFRLGEQHRHAVVEMGANHLGEIAYLTGIAKPTVGLVNDGLALLQRNRCDSVLAFGGGSSIDAGKVIALAAANAGQFEFRHHFVDKALPGSG